MKPWHMWICASFIAVAILAVALGGAAFILVPALACALMMGAMMWMMMRMGSGSGRGSGD